MELRLSNFREFRGNPPKTWSSLNRRTIHHPYWVKKQLSPNRVNRLRV